MSYLARDFSHVPLVMLDKGDNPDGKGDDDTQVGDSQVEDVEVGFVTSHFGLQIDPHHDGVGHQPYDKDKNAEEGEGVEQGALVQCARACCRVDRDAVAVVAHPVDLR